MRRWWVGGLIAVSLVAGPVGGAGTPGTVAAQPYPFCAAGETPQVADVFRPLITDSRVWIGQPKECAHTEPGGDTVQQTALGTMRLRAGSATPTFGAGNRHWAAGPTGPALHWLGDAVDPPAALSAGLPAGVSALVPADGTVSMIALADLMGVGADQWIVYFTTPRRDGTTLPWGDPAVLVAVPGDGGSWKVGTTFGTEYLQVAGMTLVPLPGGGPAVALEGGVGAHGSHIKIVRWDGAAFATVLDEGSNSPGISMEDLDGDGVPEVLNYWSPYCQSYAASPRLVTVLRWDGARFAEATGRYPQITGPVADNIREAIANRGASWQPEDRACLYWALGLLAERSGNLDDAAQQYTQALAVDPGYDLSGDDSAVPLAKEQASPVGRVKLFYQRLGMADYTRAYILLSNGLQQKQPIREWTAGYATTEKVELESAVPGSAPNTVQISVVAVDRTASGRVTRRFVGEWTLVREHDRWYLDAAQIRVAS